MVSFKYSLSVMRREETKQVQSSQPAFRFVSACFGEGTDGISDAILKRDEWARLIRKPLKAKGHALLDVCTPEGNIQRKV
ncbi:unnamed protein product, partial [Hapterophycus canaliculatus]